MGVLFLIRRQNPFFNNTPRSGSTVPSATTGTDSDPSLRVNDTYVNTDSKKTYVLTAVTATTATWTEPAGAPPASVYWYCDSAIATASKELYANSEFKIFLQHEVGTSGFNLGFLNYGGASHYVGVSGRINTTIATAKMAAISNTTAVYLNHTNFVFEQGSAITSVFSQGETADLSIFVARGGGKASLFNFKTNGEGNTEMRYWFEAIP